jgi:hypothetical protein
LTPQSIVRGSSSLVTVPFAGVGLTDGVYVVADGAKWPIRIGSHSFRQIGAWQSFWPFPAADFEPRSIRLPPIPTLPYSPAPNAPRGRQAACDVTADGHRFHTNERKHMNASWFERRSVEESVSRRSASPARDLAGSEHGTGATFPCRKRFGRRRQSNLTE